MTTVTDWFDENTAPVRVGVYEVKTHGFCMYAYWDGRKFGYRACSVNEAREWRTRKTMARDSATWRGLAEKP